MRMARTELPQQRNQRVAVVVGVGHQMAAAHVEPLDTIQILPEMPLHGLQRQTQVLGARLAQHMEVESLDPLGNPPVRRELLGRYAESRPGDTRVVEIRLDWRILRIDAQPARKAVDQGALPETIELRKGVEGNMVAVTQDFVDVAFGVDRRIGMGRTAVFLEDEAGFGGRAGRGSVRMAGQDGKDPPHGASLQGNDNLGTRFGAHTIDGRQIPVQQLLVEQVARRRHFQKVNHQKSSVSKTSAKITKSRS